MKHKPVVGITIGSGYEELSRIINRYGADVITIQNRSDLSKIRNATHLLLPGGSDIHPSFYGQTVTYARGFQVQRDRLEYQLARYAINRGMPTLGICRGLQMLIVAAGGQLMQDFAAISQVSPHRCGHEIRTEKGSVMRKLLGDQLEVNSYHHQSVDDTGDRIPKSWWATAYSVPDCIVEGVEHRTKPLIGVQFHPEYVIEARDAAGEVLILKWLEGDVPKESQSATARELPLYV